MCRIKFNIEANTEVFKAKGRYKKTNTNTWTEFDIDLNAPQTPDVKILGEYDPNFFITTDCGEDNNGGTDELTPEKKKCKECLENVNFYTEKVLWSNGSRGVDYYYVLRVNQNLDCLYKLTSKLGEVIKEILTDDIDIITYNISKKPELQGQTDTVTITNCYGTITMEITIPKDDSNTGGGTTDGNLPPTINLKSEEIKYLTDSAQTEYEITSFSYDDPDAKSGEHCVVNWEVVEKPAGAPTPINVSDNSDKPKYINLEEGTYKFKVTVTDPHGATATKTITVKIEKAKLTNVKLYHSKTEHIQMHSHISTDEHIFYKYIFKNGSVRLTAKGIPNTEYKLSVTLKELGVRVDELYVIDNGSIISLDNPSVFNDKIKITKDKTLKYDVLTDANGNIDFTLSTFIKVKIKDTWLNTSIEGGRIMFKHKLLIDLESYKQYELNPLYLKKGYHDTH